MKPDPPPRALPDVSAIESPSNVGSCSEVEAARKESVAPEIDDEVINDDERQRFNWKPRYPRQAIIRIRYEAAYVLLAFIVSLVGIFITWRGDFFAWFGCASCDAGTLSRYSYLFFSGILGGALFGLKYLYKVVARGWWNQDRELWRIFSPLLAGGMAFGVGALASAGLFGFTMGDAPSGASFVSLGFISGYFADSASRKMQEIAETLFGHPQPQPRKKGTAAQRPAE